MSSTRFDSVYIYFSIIRTSKKKKYDFNTSLVLCYFCKKPTKAESKWVLLFRYLFLEKCADVLENYFRCNILNIVKEATFYFAWGIL